MDFSIHSVLRFKNAIIRRHETWNNWKSKDLKIRELSGIPIFKIVKIKNFKGSKLSNKTELKDLKIQSAKTQKFELPAMNICTNWTKKNRELLYSPSHSYYYTRLSHPRQSNTSASARARARHYGLFVTQDDVPCNMKMESCNSVINPFSADNIFHGRRIMERACVKNSRTNSNSHFH